MKPKILTVGRVHVETAMTLPFIPSAGHTVQGKSIVRYPGGSGVNTAIALRKLGADAIVAARVGSDSNGQRISHYLSSKDVDTRYLVEDGIFETGSFVRITEESGTERSACFDGANAKLRTEDIEFAMQVCPNGMFVSTDLPDEALIAALTCGAREHLPTMLDARGDRATAVPFSSLPPVGILLLDPESAFRYTGVKPGTVESSLRCAISLSGMIGADQYVLHLGDRGVFIYDGKYYRVVSTYDQPDGGCIATDAYFAVALLSKYIVSHDMKAAAEFAVLAEAAARGRGGHAANLPSADELRRFIDRQKAEKEVRDF